MKTKQLVIDSDISEIVQLRNFQPDLMFVFGSPRFFNEELSATLKESFSNTTVVGCSTAGEIFQEGINEDSVIVNCLKFDKGTKVKSARSQVNGDIYACGTKIGKDLYQEDLKAIVVFSPGVDINGSSLITGIESETGSKVLVTGGLAGDGADFVKTFTVDNSNVYDDFVVAVGLYGDNIDVKFGSQGGWKPFGPIRKATKVDGNILYKLDDEPALDVYKKYLGPRSKDLPSAGLFYPFAVLDDNNNPTGLIRTILGINEEQGSLIMAGDMTEGKMLRLMHAETRGLIDGAKMAARMVESDKENNSFSLLISCVGRKLVLGSDTEDEVIAIKDTFGNKSTISGFYSYGEICPLKVNKESRLQNQTMTITHISEAA